MTSIETLITLYIIKYTASGLTLKPCQNKAHVIKHLLNNMDKFYSQLLINFE